MTAPEEQIERAVEAAAEALARESNPERARELDREYMALSDELWETRRTTQEESSGSDK